MQKHATLFLLLCACVQSSSAQSGTHMFDNNYVHEIRIFFEDPNFWDTLSQRYIITVDTNLANVPLPARVIIDGTEMDSVGVSQKGYFSNWGAGSSLKKPLKLDFNEYDDDEYDNLKSLNLQNAFMDPTIMRDMLSYRILRDFGAAAPRTAYAKVFINDAYWGLYVAVESVNKTFLKEHFGDNDGNLYKANYTSMHYLGETQENYYKDFELKTNEAENDWSGLIHFIKKINNTPASAFKDTISRYLDLESYFKAVAVDVTINNWDSHFAHGRNFYVYDNPADGKFHWIPWDYNLAFADDDFTSYDITLQELRSDPGYDKILPRRVLGNTTLKAQYLQIACQLHREIFTPEYLKPIIETAQVLIQDDLEDDPNKFYKHIEDFELSLTTGFERWVTDTFHFVDSTWNGSMWVPVDTFFVWEYLNVSPGLQDLIAKRSASIRNELTSVFHVECVSPASEPETLVWEVWPNPATAWLNLRTPEPGLLTFYDGNGRLCKRMALEASHIKIPLETFAAGIYWVEYTTEKERSIQKLIVYR